MKKKYNLYDTLDFVNQNINAYINFTMGWKLTCTCLHDDVRCKQSMV
jgi:hypothetical protein